MGDLEGPPRRLYSNILKWPQKAKKARPLFG
jgi:hypothetical protein